MIKIVTQEIEEWFENKGIKPHIAIYNKLAVITVEECNTRVYMNFFTNGPTIKVTRRDIDQIYGNTSFELADPEFPDNMLQDLERIFSVTDMIGQRGIE